ncbi:uncharacterized protein ACMZJ9_017883 [Mantella aurantiaca]
MGVKKYPISQFLKGFKDILVGEFSRNKRSIEGRDHIVKLTIIENSEGIQLQGNAVKGSVGDWITVRCEITMPKSDFLEEYAVWTYPEGSEHHRSTNIILVNTKNGPQLQMTLERNFTIFKEGIISCSPHDITDEVHSKIINITVMNSRDCPEMLQWPTHGLFIERTHSFVYNDVSYVSLPLLLNFSSYNIPESFPETMKIWFKTVFQTHLNLFWDATQGLKFKKVSKRDLSTDIISGLSLGSSIWNRADIESLNIREENFVGGLQKILLKGGRVDFNTLAELKIDIQDIHTIAADLQSIQTSVNALNETLNNNNVSKAMVCGIIGNLMSEHLSLGIQEIKRGEWPRIMNSTSLFSLIKNSDVTCKNFALAKIRSLDAACNKAQVGKQVIPLTIDIPTWITKPLPAYKMVVLGEMEVNNGTKILKQLLPQNRIIVKENQVWKTIDSNCCTRRGQAWLCSCSSERLEYVDGCAATHSGSCLVKLQKSEPGWQKIIHTYDSKVCALGVSLFAWQKRVQCQAPITGWCVNLTEGKLTIGDEVIQANILLEQLSMDIEQIDFGNWKSMISPLFKKIPPLTIELDTLFKRDSRRVIELQELVKENLISSNKISKEFQEPWWSIPYSTVTHPVLRTISMIFMIIQFVLICLLFGLYCCGRRQFRTIKSTKKNLELASILTAKNV